MGCGCGCNSCGGVAKRNPMGTSVGSSAGVLPALGLFALLFAVGVGYDRVRR